MSILEPLIYATVMGGFFAIIWKRNLVMKIIAMDVMSTGIVAVYVLVAARSGWRTPIVVDGQAPATAYADPVPQAVILTAIVIGLSLQALMLVGVMKLARDVPTLDVADIELELQPGAKPPGPEETVAQDLPQRGASS